MATCSSRSRRVKIGNYFGNEMKLLKIFGVSLAENDSLSYKIYSFLLLFTTAFMYTLLDTYELTKHGFDDISEMLTYQTGSVMSLTKIAFILNNRDKLRKLVEKLEKAPFAPNPKRGGGDVEKKLIKQCVFITKTQSMVYWTGSCIAVFGMMIYTLLTTKKNSDWKLVYGPLTVLNVTDSFNMKCTWFYQNVSILVISAHFSTIDLLLAGILAHISCQFKILQNSIRHLVGTSYDALEKAENQQLPSTSSGQTKIDESVVPWKYLSKSVKEAVGYHVQIADLAKEVEDVFSRLLFFIFMITLGMLCFSVFTASTAHSTATIAQHLVESINIAIPVFMVCYWGEEVTQESQLVGRAAYESNFVGTHLRYQKSLVLIIRRSQNPTVLTAGKFSIISLATFAWIIQTSYSSFMVLRKANEANTK